MEIIDFFVDLVDSSIKNKKYKELSALENKVMDRRNDLTELLEKGNIHEQISREQGYKPDAFRTIKSWKDNVEKIEKKYKRLKEKFKHDGRKSLEITEDWLEFVETVEGIYEQSWLDHSRDFFDDDFMKMEEIEKRFDKLLKD